MRLATSRHFDDFIGAQAIPLTASDTAAPWAKKLTKTAGSPTLAGLSGGQHCVEAALDATNEVQAATLYHGDVLSILMDNVQSVAFRLRTNNGGSTPIAVNQVLWAGLMSAENDAPESASKYCGFRVDGANTPTNVIAVDAKDGTNATLNDQQSPLLLPDATWLDFVIDFANGLGDVRFFAGDSNRNGRLTRILPTTTFNLAALTGQYLQFVFQLAKASGTGAPKADLDYVELLYKRS
ncbi:MAG TPA: hypothetical protein VJ783_27075 [Pirellulales bacterium]|nr:hypothetical protein [Pirellulales bacterium]